MNHMETITLSRRLAALAALVPQGSCPVDVGTDHGYLPAWLLQNGVCSRAYATDLRSKPLESAMRTAQAAGLSGQITFFLCDGLEDCPPREVDTVIIAGMGGENIAGILERAPWTREKLLILQPMSRQEVLRAFLTEHGYAIVSEHLVQDGGILYQVLTARGGTPAPHTPAELLTGRFALLEADPLLPEYLEKTLQKLRHAEAGLACASSEEAALRLEKMRAVIDGMEQEYRRLQDAERG
ncbi:MAG: class I SAM-dependent methyltransferase [Clostridiales bacterium]|nr:class I SAM-dependent methyltransferase [Clostridiales bacterium]